MIGRMPLWLKIFVALAAGIAVGLVLSPGMGVLNEDQMKILAPWIALPGNLFLALIRMIVLPLVLSSIVLGIVSTPDVDFLKRAGLKLLPYFVITTLVATILGATIAGVISPGEHLDRDLIEQVMEGNPRAEQSGLDEKVIETVSMPDRIVRLIPTNYTQSKLDQDVLATVILALFLGVAMVVADRERVSGFQAFLEGLQEISLTVVGWAMLLAPLAVFSLICRIVMRVGLEAVTGMAMYMASVILGLLLLLLFYLLVVWVLGGKPPLEFLRAVRSVQLLAFSTSSSAAVMPLSMQTAEEELGVEKPISSFIVPLGATINMDGTALYQVCATVFLTQVYGVDLSISGLAAVAFTTVGASIGTPATPGVGIVVLATILQGVGVPPSGIALIIGVDRLLDMFRTSINVTGDLVAAAVMNRWLKVPAGDETG